MGLHHLTIPFLLSWLLVLVLAGSFGGFGLAGWALLGVLGSLPLILSLQIRRGPAPTLSQSIHDARR
jgi:hypothetical protein